MQDDAAGTRCRREVDGLDILVIGPHIADMREREGDDLARIGRIGENLLGARHGGVEAYFADRLPGRAESGALQHGAIGQHQKGGGCRVCAARVGINPGGSPSGSRGRLPMNNSRDHAWSWWYLLLLLQFVPALWVPFY